MARAGRKRKEGRRDDKGKLRPINMPDRGNERTAAKREKYGTDGGDAIGRAYRMGLLGEDGQRLMQTARSIHRAYWPMFGVGPIGCTLGDRTGGGGEGNLLREQWLTMTMQRVDRMGRNHRRAFDELVLDFWPDYGPGWLDRLIEIAPDLEASKRRAARADSDAERKAVLTQMRIKADTCKNDWSKLALAISALEELTA